ncbi:MAG: hypothetical protein PHF67_01060 [Candidatus Nanoarchaeia archaeon]|nr:hypothetical protein [Candidatus Nanoarchaeia archaeon]
MIYRDNQKEMPKVNYSLSSGENELAMRDSLDILLDAFDLYLEETTELNLHTDKIGTLVIIPSKGRIKRLKASPRATRTICQYLHFSSCTSEGLVVLESHKQSYDIHLNPQD